MCAALKPVYQAANEEAALEALAAFEASELGRRYPAAIKTFTDAWDRFTPFLAFPMRHKIVVFAVYFPFSRLTCRHRYRKANIFFFKKFSTDRSLAGAGRAT